MVKQIRKESLDATIVEVARAGGISVCALMVGYMDNAHRLITQVGVRVLRVYVHTHGG